MKPRILVALVAIGAALAVIGAVSVLGATFALMARMNEGQAAALAAPSAHAATPQPAPRPSVPAPDRVAARAAGTAVATPADQQDDRRPGESEGQRSMRLAITRNPDFAALVDDPDPKVRGAMRDFFDDPGTKR